MSVAGPTRTLPEQLTCGASRWPFSSSLPVISSPPLGDGSAHARVSSKSSQDNLLLTHDPGIIAGWSITREEKVQIGGGALSSQALDALLVSPIAALPGTNVCVGY